MSAPKMPEMARTEAQTNEFRETENERRARRSRRNALMGRLQVLSFVSTQNDKSSFFSCRIVTAPVHSRVPSYPAPHSPLGVGSSRSTLREEATRDGRPARAPWGLRGGGRDRGHRFRVRRARGPRAASRGRAVGGRLVRARLAPRAPRGAARVWARVRRARRAVGRPRRALRRSDHRRRRDGRGRGAGRGDAGFARGSGGG